MREVTILSASPELKIGLRGEIDSENAEEFCAEVIAAYNAFPCNVVFVCDELEFLDSTTLGTFVKILKHVKTDGNSMKLVGLQPRLKKLFVICALDTIMEISE